MARRLGAPQHCLLTLAPRILAGSEVAHEGATDGDERGGKERTMPDTIPCPQCGAPARITERFWLDSTDGPIEHLKTGCSSKHWLTPLAEMVQAEQVATPDRDLAARPS
jgi:hypothetical protein